MGFVGSRYVPLEFGARVSTVRIWEFPKIRGTRFGVLIIRTLLFKVPYLDPLFSETPNRGFTG